MLPREEGPWLDGVASEKGEGVCRAARLERDGVLVVGEKGGQDEVLPR